MQTPTETETQTETQRETENSIMTCLLVVALTHTHTNTRIQAQTAPNSCGALLRQTKLQHVRLCLLIKYQCRQPPYRLGNLVCCWVNFDSSCCSISCINRVLYLRWTPLESL